MKLRLLAALLLLAPLAGDAVAADEAAVLRLRAEQLAYDGRCDEAVPVLREARRLDPQDARIALLEGECFVRERQYLEAIEPLETARDLDPSLSEATLYLGMCHFQLGDYAKAEPELERATQELRSPGLIE